MKLRFCAATLAFAVAGAVCQHAALAQFGNLAAAGRSQQAAAPRSVGSAAYYQPNPAPAGSRAQASRASASASTLEPLPDGASQSTMHGGPAPMPAGGEYVMDDGMSGGYSESYGGYGDGCCSTCGNYGSNCCCLCPPGMNMNICSGSGGQFFFTADYLYVRANFSQAVSYLDQDTSNQNLGIDNFHQLDFQYESSYRFGGGYRLCGCGDEIRFMFTRLSSNAFDVVPEGSFVPYEAAAPPDGQTNIYGDVDVKSYDVEFAKKIPLCVQSCGNSCGDCCDPCGSSCGCDGCGCPQWELTWTGGFRFAQVDWNRNFVAVDAQGGVATDASAVMNFRGGGPRVGLEGRRFFCDNMLSVYMKGDISLLLGHLNLVSQRVVDGGSTPDIENIQSVRCRHIIPVTEIETGLSGQVTSHAMLTAGYMFSAWHDLGFRDEFNFPTLMETSYDDANILAFDGFFARLQVSF